ncbi:hypothetical protein IMZ48_22430 [Candidatus Bathyarchaeota archaeon]|nr:hypothetical protein [Candidatus Bathyarchaeota archaeon]
MSCKTCDESFPDASLLQNHVQQAHTRPLPCVFGFAGCPATFGSKNEWKRHVLAQHIILSYWRCTDRECVKATPGKEGCVFTRKDLYTQHVRRTHVPKVYMESVARKEHVPEWDRNLHSMQDAAERTRCELPTYMECPAVGCSAEFSGARAWDDRMEHVAKHLDPESWDHRGDHGHRTVVFGGDKDRTLTEWATSPEVNILRRSDDGETWELVVPLKGANRPPEYDSKGGGE